MYSTVSGGWEEDPIRVRGEDIVTLYLVWETGGQRASGSWAYKYSPSLSMFFDSEDITVKQGTSGIVTVSVFRKAESAGAVLLEVEGLPWRVRAEISPNPASGDRSTLTIVVDSTAALGSYPIRVRGASGDLVTYTENLLTLTIAKADQAQGEVPDQRPANAAGATVAFLMAWIPFMLLLGICLVVGLGR